MEKGARGGVDGPSCAEVLVVMFGMKKGRWRGGPGTYGMGREGASQKRRGERSERLGGYLLRDGRGWRGCRHGACSSNMYNPLHPTSCPCKKRKKSRFSRHSSLIRKDTKVTLKSLIEQPGGGGEPRIQSKHGFVSWENRSVDTHPPAPPLHGSISWGGGWPL